MGGDAAKVVVLKRRPCPVCGKAPDARFQPFCSKRCADLDLGKWLSEEYRLPTNEAPDPDEIPDEE